MIDQALGRSGISFMPYCNKPASVAPSSASNRGLYDPTFERDSCGVGFVADMSGRKSHATIQSGLQVLKNLQHRGACGCDQDTGDGAGILMQLPDLFFRSDNTSLSDRLPAAGDYGVAFVFLPRGGAQRLICHRTLEAVVAAEGQKITAFRADDYYWRDLGKPENISQTIAELKRGLLALQ